MVVLLVKALHCLLLWSEISCGFAGVMGSEIGLGELGGLWPAEVRFFNDGGQTEKQGHLTACLLQWCKSKVATKVRVIRGRLEIVASVRTRGIADSMETYACSAHLYEPKEACNRSLCLRGLPQSPSGLHSAHRATDCSCMRGLLDA